MRSRLSRSAGAVALLVTVLVGVAPSADAAARKRAPKVSGVAASSGPVSGGTTVTVRGRNLTKVKAVVFGATKARSVRRLSSTKLVVVAPRHGVGAVDIRVRTAKGWSGRTKHDRFTFVAAPTVTAVSPARGVSGGGTRITLTGRDFRSVRAVSFGAVAGTALRVLSPTRLQVTAPRHSGSAAVAVRVTGLYGSSAPGGAGYTYVAPPAVLSIDPPSGAKAGGERVTITGRDLAGTSEVRIGGSAAQILGATTATRVQVIAPAHSALEAVNVTVRTPYGTSAGNRSASYSYVAAPAPTATTQVAPGPSGYAPVIRGTACTDATCYAVGSYTTDFAEIPIIETLADGAWSWSYAPLPTDAGSPRDARLSSLSCTADRCVAVGQYYDSHDQRQSVVDTLADGIWSASKVNAPSAGADSYLKIVGCVSPTRCVAAGRAQSTMTLSVYDGSFWITQYAPMPAGLDGKKADSTSIACASSTLCVVTAIYTDGNDPQVLTETYDGRQWSPRLQTLPPTATYALVFSTSCPGAEQCVAVGQVGFGDHGPQPLLLSVTRGVWSSRIAPLPADQVPADGTINRLLDVACAQNRCTAVGDYNAADGDRTLLVQLDQGTWTASAGTAADTGSQRYVPSIACVDGRRCVTVGQQTPASGPSTPVADVRGPGGTTAAAVPLPAGVTGTDMTLGTVSCSTAGRCVALGRVQTDPSQNVLVVIDS